MYSRGWGCWPPLETASTSFKISLISLRFPRSQSNQKLEFSIHQAHCRLVYVLVEAHENWFYKTWPLFEKTLQKMISTVQALSVLTKASVWYEIRVLWAKITHVKSHAMTLAFILQTDMNQIFQMRYCTSKLRGCKNIRGQSWRSKKIYQFSPTLGEADSNLAELAIFSTSNFGHWYFCSPLTWNISVQYLIWKM